MTVTASDLGLYAVAVAILFLTPGPVWVALLARALSGGFRSAWPLALGVVIGDAIWPFLAIIGVTWIVSVYAGFLTVLKWVAVAFFIGMGIMILRNANKEISTDNRLTRPGMWAGFVAGLAVILGNPKAILFYMGMLPGFFDLSTVTAPDIAAIMAVSMVVPLAGNLLLAAFVERLRRLLSTPKAIRRMNISAGCMLIVVGLIIPFT